jgi:type II secretory pathway component PulF
MLKLPGFGPIMKNFAVARIARVLGVLINGKVPLLEALALARHTARNVHYVDLVARAEEAVTRGSSMSSAFAVGNLVTPSLCEAIKSGEQSGQMGPLLLSIADFLDEDNEVVLKSLTSILEPAILIVLGLLVGFVALSMFMPLFDLTSMTQGGH